MYTNICTHTDVKHFENIIYLMILINKFMQRKQYNLYSYIYNNYIYKFVNLIEK